MQKRPYLYDSPHILSPEFPFLAESAVFLPKTVEGKLLFHDCAEFVCCRSGGGLLSYGEYTFPFSEGDILFIGPYQPHALSEKDGQCGCEFIWVDLAHLFDPEIFGRIRDFTRRLMFPFFIFPVIHGEEQPLLTEMLFCVIDEARRCRPYYEMSIRGYFMCVISLLKSFREKKATNSSTGGTVGKYEYPDGAVGLYPALYDMECNYARDIRIHELAKLCRMSETHFRRRFKSWFAMSPLDYLNHIRVRESCYLLSRNKLLISQAAERAGFRTLSCYNRKFHEVMGISPSAWVKKYLHPPDSL